MAYNLNVGNDGRIVIPKEIRQMLGIKANSKVIANFDENGMYITTTQIALIKARSLVKKYCKSDISIVDQFIEEKREEVLREEKKFSKRRKND